MSLLFDSYEWILQGKRMPCVWITNFQGECFKSIGLSMESLFGTQVRILPVKPLRKVIHN